MLYWCEPPYARFIRYPQALQFLKFLKFLKAIFHPIFPPPRTVTSKLPLSLFLTISAASPAPAPFAPWRTWQPPLRDMAGPSPPCLYPSSSPGLQALPNFTSLNSAASPVICFSRRISSRSMPRCLDIQASLRPRSCSSLMILLIRSTL